MALEYQLSHQTFTGTGKVSVYQVDFPVFDAAHIAVAGETASGADFAYTQGTQYAVALLTSSAGLPAGAVVTLRNPLPSGYRMTIRRTLPIVQEAVFSNQGGMQPKIVERQLDYLTMVCQQLFYQSFIGDGSVEELAAALAALETAVAGKAALSHAHAVADVTGLKAALDGKAPASHSHAVANVTGLQAALDARALTSHVHAVANVTGLQAILDAKAALSHSHAVANVAGLQAALDSKAATGHVHAVADVTGLQPALDAKADAGAIGTALDAKADKSELAGRIAGLENALAAAVAAMMPPSPADGRLYIASGRTWHLFSPEPGEPFDYLGGGVSPILRPFRAADIWDVAEDGATLKPAVADLGGLWDSVADGLVLKAFAPEDAASMYFDAGDDGAFLKGAVA